MAEKTKIWKPILFGILLVGCVVIAFEVGQRMAPPANTDTGESSEDTDGVGSDEKESAVKWWTCSMHPQVKLPSGDMKCPICFMELIPMEEGGGEEGIPEISFSERARFLAEVETLPVEVKEVTKSVLLVGKIQPDETKLAMITAWVPGRLERLFVDYTGMEVRKGDHLVELYSPELYSAQQELLQAISSFGEMKGSKSELLLNTSESLIGSAKEKLVRLGLTTQQVEEIIEKREPVDTLTIYSPASGIITARQGTEGEYVKEGSMIYTIADLSEVWLLMDAYESDVEWLHYGQTVEFETEAYPGETFTGTLSFISPVLDERSRTVTLRVNVPNGDLRLKPGMFASAKIRAVPSTGGKVIAPEMMGKWICPMHPEVVEEFFGHCPICQMPLETAESLGYVVHPGSQDLPLVIPDTAPLVTGKRAIVYVEKKKEDGIYYEGRVVELGPRADGYYLVESGLEEGDVVVTKGNFKIDSALQIQAKTSMMNPADTTEAVPEAPAEAKDKYKPVAIPKEFSDAVNLVLTAYLSLQEALAADSFEKAKGAANELSQAAESLGKRHLSGNSHNRWMEDTQSLKESSVVTAQTGEIEKMRESFYPLSKAVETFVRHFGHDLDSPLRRAFCPMALDGGATWLQVDETIANPYYGASMLRCGEIQETYPATSDVKEGDAPKELPKDLAEKVKTVLDTYLDLQAALAGDSFENAEKAADVLGKESSGLPNGTSDWEAKAQWDTDVNGLKESASKVSEATEIETLREHFYPLSEALENLVRDFGNVREEPIRWAFCPMALEGGAYWLQTEETIANPYFGASMLRCGEIKATYPSQVADKE